MDDGEVSNGNAVLLSNRVLDVKIQNGTCDAVLYDENDNDS